MTDEPEPDEQPGEVKTKMPKWITVGLPLLAMGGCTAVYAASGSDNDEPSPEMAEIMCEGFVEDRLKSPGTADFQRPTAASAGVNTWRVSGSVDSENSFGASIRLDYICTVRGDGDGGWTLVDMETSED